MPKASTEGNAWEELRSSLDELRALAAQPEVDLVSLGKGYQRLSKAMLAAAKAAGQSSARFEAAVCALDLSTPKSRLNAFLDRAAPNSDSSNS